MLPAGEGAAGDGVVALQHGRQQVEHTALGVKYMALERGVSSLAVLSARMGLFTCERANP